jgi:hypothetical protein
MTEGKIPSCNYYSNVSPLSIASQSRDQLRNILSTIYKDSTHTHTHPGLIVLDIFSLNFKRILPLHHKHKKKHVKEIRF